MNFKNAFLKYEEKIAYSDTVRATSLMDYTAVPGDGMKPQVHEKCRVKLPEFVQALYKAR